VRKKTNKNSINMIKKIDAYLKSNVVQNIQIISKDDFIHSFFFDLSI